MVQVLLNVDIALAGAQQALLKMTPSPGISRIGGERNLTIVREIVETCEWVIAHRFSLQQVSLTLAELRLIEAFLVY